MSAELGNTMKNKYIEQFEAKQIEGKNVPDFRAGDTLKLAIRIKEGDKTKKFKILKEFALLEEEVE